MISGQRWGRKKALSPHDELNVVSPQNYYVET